jgi:ABC-2 type transport system ATP-binding protein
MNSDSLLEGGVVIPESAVSPGLISAKSLRVDYEGITAVDDLDIDVAAGQIYGLVGPNGAGKTSTIKALAGILEPTYGEIRINGIDMDVSPEAGWNSLGYMPDFPPVYENLTVQQYLEVFATAHLVPRHERLRRGLRWVTQVGLEEKWHTMVRDLSRGMRQRLVLAKSLLHEPSVLLLDEPASGMDPIGRIELRNVLKEAASQGAAVLISSHILTELSDMCTAIGVMEKGRMVVSGTLDDIRRHGGMKSQLYVRVAEESDAIQEKLRSRLEACTVLEEPTPSSATEWAADFEGTDEDAAALLEDLIAAGIPVADFHVEKRSIEDIFMKIGAREVS